MGVAAAETVKVYKFKACKPVCKHFRSFGEIKPVRGKYQTKRKLYTFDYILDLLRKGWKKETVNI